MEGFRDLRKKKGLKQYELAQKIGVSVVTLRKYEQGKTFPKPYILHKLSVELSVNIAVLYKLSGGLVFWDESEEALVSYNDGKDIVVQIARI